MRGSLLHLRKPPGSSFSLRIAAAQGLTPALHWLLAIPQQLMTPVMQGVCEQHQGVLHQGRRHGSRVLGKELQLGCQAQALLEGLLQPALCARETNLAPKHTDAL